MTSNAAHGIILICSASVITVVCICENDIYGLYIIDIPKNLSNPNLLRYHPPCRLL